MPSQITEREVASELASELTKYIEQGGTPFERATVEHRAGSKYPDITIWLSYASKQAFAFWELKRPGLREELAKLPEKAQALGVRYVVVWNFQDGNLYEVEGGRLQQLKSYPIPLLNSLDEWANPSKRIGVIKHARQILDDLARLAQGQNLTPFVPDKFYFIGILQQAIHQLHPALQNRLFEAKKDKNTRKRLNDWAVKQGYPLGTPDLDQLLARHWAYSLAVRILFYFTVRRYYPGLPDLRLPPDDTRGLALMLKDAFSKAQSVDWQAVFENSPLDDLGLPPAAEPILRELLNNLHRYDFGQLKEDVIGQIMEGLIPEEERHALGQYFTREDLVDLIIGFVADDAQGFYLDPTCGSGTFLNRLYSRLRWLSSYEATHKTILEKLWGIDIAHFPAELATINLFRQNVKDFSNFPRIIVRDFFKVRPGQRFSFPPLKITGTDYRKIEVELPTFHGIVGNFPYIRQELIERQSPGYKREIVKAIAREWFWKDQNLFKIKGVRPAQLEQIREMSPDQRDQWLEEQVQKGHVDLRLSGQADIYAYLFYHAAAFLEEGGRMGIVTSNAWLDVAYGEELKRFFLRHFKIIAIVASWCEPWFEDAAINTAFVVLERCEDPTKRSQNIVRFVKVKKPLSAILPRDLLLQEGKRWQEVDALVREVEAADAQTAKWDPTTGQLQPLQGVHTVKTTSEVFRIRLVPQAELEAELEAKGQTAKWGPYIRAPQVYFDILQAVGDKLVPLGQVAEVRRGYTTGINDFFYLEPLDEPAQTPGAVRVKNARGWVGEIEAACLRPVIKSPKEVKSLMVDSKNLGYRLFLPPVDPDSPHPEKELRTRYPLAYHYVKWGEQQRTPTGQPWPEVPSVRGRRAWWLAREATIPHWMWPKAFNDRFFILQNAGKVLSSDRFYEVVAKEEDLELELMGALLNSTLVALFIEVNGRVNLGDGALDNMTYEAEQCFVPNPKKIPADYKEKICSAYRKLSQRPIKIVKQEIKQKDRHVLDEAVLEALGLDPKKYLPRIYEGLVEMVEERLALAKMRASRGKKAKRLSIDQLKEHVQQDVLPAGLKPITAFLSSCPETRMVDIPLTGRPISWQHFLTEIILLDEKGAEVGKITGDETIARYVIYAAKAGQYVIKLPSDPIVISKAVQDYENYLREIGRELVQRALEAIRDHKQAERIAREILKKLELPPLALEKAMGS